MLLGPNWNWMRPFSRRPLSPVQHPYWGQFWPSWSRAPVRPAADMRSGLGLFGHLRVKQAERSARADAAVAHTRRAVEISADVAGTQLELDATILKAALVARAAPLLGSILAELVARSGQIGCRHALRFRSVRAPSGETGRTQREGGCCCGPYASRRGDKRGCCWDPTGTGCDHSQGGPCRPCSTPIGVNFGRAGRALRSDRLQTCAPV